jgi:general secretion pathway protein G
MGMPLIPLRIGRRGVSLVELVVTLSILAILASLVLPSARMTAKRTKEIELRRNLRTIRLAIDDYKKAYDKANEGRPAVVNKSGYPETLQKLVEGEDFGGQVKVMQKFLRNIPVDPFYPENDPERRWGLRSYADKPDSTTWGGEDVFDVYSQSEEIAIDGTKYKDW